jgi:hypothetical protein
MGGIQVLDLVIDVVVLAIVIAVAAYFFTHRDKQPNWHQEETRNPRGALIAYRIFFAMGLFFTVMGAWNGRFTTVVSGLVIAAWSGWRWVRFRRRRAASGQAVAPEQ